MFYCVPYSYCTVVTSWGFVGCYLFVNIDARRKVRDFSDSLVQLIYGSAIRKVDRIINQ